MRCVQLDNDSGRLFPLRWLAPETLRYARYSRESDIWAFGVLLWEIFTNAQHPYFGHSNDEVCDMDENNVFNVFKKKFLSRFYVVQHEALFTDNGRTTNTFPNDPF